MINPKWCVTDNCCAAVSGRLFPRHKAEPSPYLGGFEGIICGKVNGEEENSTLERAVILKMEKHVSKWRAPDETKKKKTQIGNKRKRKKWQVQHLT